MTANIIPMSPQSQPIAPAQDGYLVTYESDEVAPELYTSLPEALSIIEYAMGFDDCNTVTIERVKSQELIQK